jgi:hypothetical protein
MEWAGVISGAVAAVVAVIALLLGRRDRGADRLEAVERRLTRVETQMEPFWAAVQADLIKILHHPHPEWADMDALLDKLDPGKPGTLTRAERAELKADLRRIIDDDPADPPPFPVSSDERVVAVFLLHAMDLVGGK